MNINHAFTNNVSDTALITGSELNSRLFTLIDELTEANKEQRQAAINYAKAEHRYRQARATSYFTVKNLPENQKATVATLEALVDKSCSEEQQAAYMARAMEKASDELVKSLRAQLSALQSVAATVRAETDLAKF